jgi:hypothetical protein
MEEWRYAVGGALITYITCITYGSESVELEVTCHEASAYVFADIVQLLFRLLQLL